MKTVNLYFAGAFKGKASETEAALGITKKLCSFLYPDQLDSWANITEKVPGMILIDSGAFSAWNKGDVVDFDKYIEYCHQALQDPRLANKKIRVVNLDVIPGKKGETKNLNSSSSVNAESKQIINDAAAQGLQNLMYFKSKGITPIHVYHQGENIDWLLRMVEETDYIGVSPANDLSVTQKRMWIDKTFSFIEQRNIKVDTHGFAVWSPGIIADYPWTSCDAATWRLLSAYGGIYMPVGGFTNPDYSQPPLIIHISDRMTRFEKIPFNVQMKEILETDGYVLEDVQQKWETRSEINIRYFLGFEKWVNEKKSKTEYRPTRSFQLR